MCECGCTSNDTRYTMPGPGKSFYIVSLCVACVECDAPPGITIELIEPGHILWDEYKRGEFTDGPLKFEKWPSNLGAAIVTGFRRHEFVAAVQGHLTGINVADFDDEDGRIDEIGAEVILEEMYRDSWVKPKVVEPHAAKAITIDLPLPPKCLHPNQRTFSRRQHEAAVSKARNESGLLAKLKRPDTPFVKAEVRAVFHVARRNDTDNLTAWLKSYLDGLQDGGIIANDRDLTLLPPEQVTNTPAGERGVVLTITPK